MARSSVFVSQTRYVGINGLAKLQAKIAAMPDEIVSRVKPALEQGADLLVAKYQEIAPVSELETHPGQLRESAHREPGRHELSVLIVVDARDANGEEYPAHVEYGHKARDGSHVPAVPAFWPAYQVTKKKIKSLVTRAGTAGAKAAAALGGSSAA